MRLPEAFRRLYKRWRNDIHFFAREMMRMEPSEQQSELLQAIEDFTLGRPGSKRHIAVMSAQGCGKTIVTNVGMLWRTFRHVRAPTYVTAPTMRQATTVWMGSLRRQIDAAHPVIRKTVHVDNTKATLCKMNGWEIHALTASKQEALQGHHHPHMTILVEEASGVGLDIMEVIEGTSTERDNMVCMIGNPNSKASPLYPPFANQRRKWKQLQWSGLDSPFVTEENLEYLRDKYGEDSDIYRVRGLGQWPKDDPGIVISLDEIEKCLKLDMREMSMLGKGVQQFGVDLARFGGDETVVFQRKGNAIVDWKFMSHVEPVEAMNWALSQMHEWSWREHNTYFVVDASGIGQGVVGEYHRRGLHTKEFHTQGTASLSNIYANAMTEAWFHVRDLMRAGKCYLPNDTRLIEQLSSRMYGFDTKNRLLIEPKKEYRKRTTLESPDRADAFVLAFYEAYRSGARVTKKEAGSAVGARVFRR